MENVARSQCGICNAQSVTKAAVKWCAECDDSFCSDCLKYHKLSKASKQHPVVDIAIFKKIPEFILNIKQDCEEHGERYQMYCSSHDSLCCIKCINNIHQTCINLKTLDDLVQNPKSSTLASLDELEKSLQNLKSFYLDISREQNTFIETLKVRRKSIEDEISQFRSQINHLLDSLEEQLRFTLKEKHNEILTQIQETSENITICMERTTSLLEAIPLIKQHTSNIHVFLGTKLLEVEVGLDEQKVEDLKQQDRLIQCYPTLSTRKTIIDFLKDVNCLGEIGTKVEKTKVIFRKLKDKQAQLVAKVPHYFSEINIKHIKNLKISLESNSTIAACSILANGKTLILIISSYVAATDDDPKDAKLLVLKADETDEYSINVSSWAFDMISINDKIVAVSSTRDPKIVFINILTKSEDRCIDTQHVCYGIGYDGDKLYTCGTHGFETRRLTTNKVIKLNIKSGNPEGFPTYIRFALYANKIIAIDSQDDIVTCYDIVGSVKWKWSNRQILKGLMGIAIDKDGNVYVTGRDSQNLVIITKDGKRYKSIKVDTVLYPGAIYFDNNTCQLLVCGEQGGAALYSVLK